MVARIILGTLLICVYAFSIERGEEIRLWPHGAPGSEGETADEAFEKAADSKIPKRFTVVHYPSIYVFLAAKEKANGMAVVVAPGGGHSQLVIDKEGWEIADWLNRNGIAAFVLKYRLARAPGSHYTVEGNALPDAARAVRTVRSRANEWGIDPARIGFMGFSAGGELAALIETRFDAGNTGAGDPVERASSRPDFAAAIYPGFKPGTIAVPKDAPPMFLMCTDEDRSHVVTTVNLYLDLEKQGVPTEMHIYASGPHGVGMRPSHLPVATWPDRLRDWMIDRKLLKESRRHAPRVPAMISTWGRHRPSTPARPIPIARRPGQPASGVRAAKCRTGCRNFWGTRSPPAAWFGSSTATESPICSRNSASLNGNG
jgi:acetyl esterase/lipase